MQNEDYPTQLREHAQALEYTADQMAIMAQWMPATLLSSKRRRILRTRLGYIRKTATILKEFAANAELLLQGIEQARLF